MSLSLLKLTRVTLVTNKLDFNSKVGETSVNKYVILSFVIAWCLVWKAARSSLKPIFTLQVICRWHLNLFPLYEKLSIVIESAVNVLNVFYGQTVTLHNCHWWCSSSEMLKTFFFVDHIRKVNRPTGYQQRKDFDAMETHAKKRKKNHCEGCWVVAIKGWSEMIDRLTEFFFKY